MHYATVRPHKECFGFRVSGFGLTDLGNPCINAGENPHISNVFLVAVLGFQVILVFEPSRSVFFFLVD